MLDEPCQGTLGLGGGDGEQARPIGADGLEVHLVEVAPNLLVDVVLAGLVRGRHFQCRLFLRWGLAVVLVVVPPVADGIGAVHQDVESTALVAVEVLHPETGALACPFLKVLAGQGECRRRQNVGDQPLLAEPVDELLGGVGGGLVDQDRALEALERVGVGVGLDEGRAVTEIAVRMAQRREHQVQLLPVITPLGQGRGGLHQQHLAMRVLAAVHRRAELVGEQPQGSVVTHMPDSRRGA